VESRENKPRKINDPDMMKIITVGALVIVLIAVFFLITRGSTFCLFSSNCTGSGGHDSLLAAGAGLATAAVLTAVTNAPVLVAVGVGIAVWWIVNNLLF
jgi:hypothetical protein